MSEWRCIYEKPAPEGASSCFTAEGRNFYAGTWRLHWPAREFKSFTRRSVVMGTLIVMEMRKVGDELELRMRACPESIEPLDAIPLCQR